MFGIGYQEMFVVLVVAMIIFGPSRLPELAGQVGRWVRDFRRMSSDLTGEFEKTFAEVDEVKKSFQREFESIQDEVDGVGKSARGDLKKSAARSNITKKPAPLGAGAKAAAKGTTAKSTKTTSNSARATGTGSSARAKLAANGKSANAIPVATKDDPLVDVSFLDLDVLTVKTGGAAAGNGASHGTEDDALVRVRRRRASAAYARRVPA